MKIKITHQGYDDGLEWLRAIRRKITSDFDHDQKKIGDYLREREKTMSDRIVHAQKRLVPARPCRAEKTLSDSRSDTIGPSPCRSSSRG